MYQKCGTFSTLVAQLSVPKSKYTNVATSGPQRQYLCLSCSCSASTKTLDRFITFAAIGPCRKENEHTKLFIALFNRMEIHDQKKKKKSLKFLQNSPPFFLPTTFDKISPLRPPIFKMVPWYPSTII